MIKKLWKYVWPEDRPQIRRRVTLAVGLLVASKFLNVGVPFIFGAIVDLLNKSSGVAVASDAAAAGASVIFALVIGCTFACMSFLYVFPVLTSLLFYSTLSFKPLILFYRRHRQSRIIPFE